MMRTAKTAKRITNNDAEELEADLSPDGKKVSFVRGNDLFVVDVASGKETQFDQRRKQEYFERLSRVGL